MVSIPSLCSLKTSFMQLAGINAVNHHAAAGKAKTDVNLMLMSLG